MADRPRRALIIGGSRGIGAASARRFAQSGWEVGVTYLRHAARAEQVASDLRALTAQAHVFAFDVCCEQSLQMLRGTLDALFGPIDTLVHAASGGLEAGVPQDYADRINRVAPIATAYGLLDKLTVGGSIIFLTSHEAHFHLPGQSYEPYDLIASTKHAGELALHAAAADINRRGAVLKIISADLVEDSYTAKLLERGDPGHTARRREQVGRLPTAEDVADEILWRADDASIAGAVSYVFEPGSRYDGRPRHAPTAAPFARSSS